MRRDYNTKPRTPAEENRRYRALTQIRRDRNLSAWARLVYAELDDIAGSRSDVAHPKQKFLAETLGASISTIKRALRELKKYHFAEVIESKSSFSKYRLTARTNGPQLVTKPTAAPIPPAAAAPILYTVGELTRKQHAKHGPEFKTFEEFKADDPPYACHRWKCQCGWTGEWYSIRSPLPQQGEIKR